jgi:hypothetical protein
MEILSQMDEESRERLRKKELQVYTRQKNAPQAPPSDPIFPRPRPPIPSNDKVPPQPTFPKNDEIDLNIDMDGILEKVNIHVPLIEIIKIPSMRNKVEIFLKVQGEPRDPPILLQANHLRRTNEDYPPFFITLEVNNMWLNNCMLDSGASTNVMTLKVMKQLGLEITRPYGNVCGIDSKEIRVYGLIEDLLVHLARYLEIVIVMDVVVLDVLDTWGMILSRKWVATLGGTLHMDLSYATIPIGKGHQRPLIQSTKEEDPCGNPEYDSEFKSYLEEDHSDDPIDSPLGIDLDNLPQEEDILDVIWPKREDYQNNLTNTKTKKLVPLQF